MVVFTENGREEELIEIWKQCFGDSKDYIRMFLDWNLKKTTVAAYEVEGKVVSVAYLLPVTYEKRGQKSVECLYLYAAATLPKYRGLGYFAGIMKAIRENISKPILLVPGEKSLISYYEKQQMHVWLEGKSLQFSVDQEGNLFVEASAISPSEYASKREKFLLDRGYIKWDEHFMNYIFHENIVCGGCQEVLTVSGTEYITMYRVEGSVLKIIELLPQGDLIERDDTKHSLNVSACVRFLLKKTGCQKAQVDLQPTVMVTNPFPSIQNEGYFNLTLG